MPSKSRAVVLGLFLFAAAAACLFAGDAPRQADRERFMAAFKAGNFKDAFEGLRKLALDPHDDPAQVGDDLKTGIQCLQRLGRVDEIDGFREDVIAAHKTNWRLLETAAQTYVEVEHYGFIVAGKFYRGNHRGGGRYVNSMQRDRVRALQLMNQALPLARDDGDHPAVARFDLRFATILLQGAGQYQPWRLQYLTDLTKLPDYDEGWAWYAGTSGAPVADNGDPILYHVPMSWEKARNDGERWRWLLTQAAELDHNLLNETDVALADFLHDQLGVQTLATCGPYLPSGDDRLNAKTGTFALSTLEDNETIARLATGIKRFKLPDEFNWILIYQRVAARPRSKEGEHSLDTLAQIFENRRQYDKAAATWKQAIAQYGPGAPPNPRWRQDRLEQIVGNWGRFEPAGVQPAGHKPTVDFRFRNGDKVSFEAHTINVPKLLDDVKAYLRSNPGMVDWSRVNVGDIGYRLVQQQQGQYLGDRIAAWDLDLKPRPGHVDDRVTVTAPLDRAGAYLLTAHMAGGNESRIIVWVSDTLLVRKQLEGRNYYFVADTVTGKPVARADVDFFGWEQVQVQPNRPVYRVDTVAFTTTTDDDGQVIVGQDRMLPNHQWLVTARKAKDGQAGGDRFAYLGFDYAWYNRIYDPEYNQTKVFTITDRPVYRPGQTVQFKFWVRHAKYDQPNTSDFADQPFVVQIHNPRGEKVLEKTFTADAYGGIAGEFPLPKDAMLGAYGLMVVNHGGGSFRVEEYKKPEYEVTVEAPKEPVRLGEPVVATVRAKYYFGAPVVQAKVKVKVLRQAYSDTWYPRGAWDWFYGAGYWWFAPDYDWFPGFGRWGTPRPVPIWWRRPAAPPEVVLENEVNVGPDGTVQVPIDTSLVKELHGNEDHKYTITAEVTDDSRRTIVGTGDVLVSREPFKVFAWVDRGHYRAGDTVRARFRAQTLDRKPVEGKGELTLYKVNYDEKHEPVEKPVQTWKLDTNAEGEAHEQMVAARPGQYRLSYRLTDAKGHTIEGGYLFVVTGDGYDGHQYRFNDIELITDKREYAPGEKVKLLINTNREDSTVLLFLRPTNGIYVRPEVLRLHGKSTERQIAVVQRDMPNFFVEALTVSGGKVHTEVREVVVPPEKRVLNVTVLPSAKEYRPGQKASVKVKVTDFFGKPFVGSTVLTVYDRSVEYIAGGSNVPEIREFFWKWRRHHSPQTETDANRFFGNLLRPGEIGMSDLGVFGASVVEEIAKGKGEGRGREQAAGEQLRQNGLPALAAAPGGMMAGGFAGRSGADRDGVARRELQADKKPAEMPPVPPGQQPGGGGQQPVVRKNFADTAFWAAALTTDKDGTAEVSFAMPEQLAGWKIKAWSLGHGTKVGEGEAEVVTKKDLLVRLQAPRFFTQTDEVVLSANVHNYLKAEKAVKVSLELDGGTLINENEPVQSVSIPAGTEKRVDWRVRVVGEGQAVVRMKAVADEESDAVEMRFPCYVHGMLKMEAVSGAIRPNQDSATATLTVPAERRINETRLEVRWSPTLAGAMVDALPYLVDYPYGCTEQTLNRFLPTVITQRVLQRMNLDLKAIRDKRTNLNAQEIGDAKERAKGWKRYPHNPVFDEAEVQAMARAGVEALAGMQLGDGGWGWFSGYGEQSWPHTTALVVHGLQIARENDVALPPGMLERGVQWLRNYQETQLQLIRNAPSKTEPYKPHADNLDALVYMVLVDVNAPNDEMREYLYRDRNELTVYAKALFGLALQKQQQADKLAMVLKNLSQYVVQDDEDQTAYLKMPEGNAWWYWYGSDVEADAAYLKLLARTDPKGETAPRLVKYLLNNRKHATWWDSTRDTSFCIEAMAEFLKTSGEDRPDMTVEVLLDGHKMKEVHVDASNLFTFDNQLVLTGDAVDTGKHTLELRRKGTGPVYWNAYLTNFTLENFITRAGLEVRVNRKYYKLNRVDKTIKVTDVRGQAIDQKVEKYERQELPNLSTLKSGDLVEVELEIDSKNDYEYLIFEDPKAAGFEPLLVRSGYNANDLGAYMELRDEKVCFFVRRLARGKHSVSYRLRAEIPGRFSALPTRAYAMYAPELRGNSDEIKLAIAD